ncbi:MAG: glycosyltransferase [Spirochaetales bacterium]|nr:glycosyltransferase [Spirochaetales bacterium]MCF7937742.1 glycosyltransferase [Spirochaetales bacterium]
MSEVQQPKILILSSTVGRGGADKQIIALSSEAARRGWRCRIVSFTPLGIMGTRAREKGHDIRVIGFSGLLLPLGFLRLIFLAVGYRPDVTVSFMFHATIAGRFLRFLGLGGRHISSVRSINMGSPRREQIFRRTRERDAACVVNSNIVADALLERDILALDRLHVIPNAVEIPGEEPEPAVSGSLRAEGKSGVFTWLIVARITPAKDYDTLLAAVRLLADREGQSAERGGPAKGQSVASSYRRLSFRVLSVGDGSESDRIHRRAEELGLGQYLQFLGGKDEIGPYLASADAFVFSSAWEGLPNSVMEAQAAGLPVVSTAVGGVPEIVLEEKTGFLVPPKDPESLAGAMERMMDFSIEERDSMGRRGKAHMMRAFSPEIVLERWIDTIQFVLKYK